MVAPDATTLILDAPITAVVVYPQQARVTRRGTVTLPPGAEDTEDGAAEDGAAENDAPEVTVTLGGLPMELDTSSVRVSGRGAVRVLGVDVVVESRAVTTDPRLAELEDEVDRLRRRARELADDQETEQARRRFLDVAARNGAAALARGWGAPSWSRGPAEGGTTTPSGEERRLAEAGGALATQLAGVHARLRAIADEQENIQKLTDAARRALEARRGVRLPDARQVVVTLEPTGGPGAAAGGEVDVELEVSYLVASASWSARYDARLVDGVVTLTWFGMVRQRSGEDWPAGDLRLSTARPGRASGLPELTPWYVDVARPAMPFALAAGGGAFAGGAAFDAAAEMTPVPVAARAKAPGAAPPPPPVEHAVATVDTSGTAATYRPARPVAVPADGRPHRTTLAVLELEAQLDYLTVPKLAPEAYLRATVTNTSAHTLLPGPVAVFHAADFVGTSTVELVAPGAEVELQLGVDDRLLVERELVSRATSRKVVGNLRRTDVGYVITLTNHTPRPARVTVRDQIPVSRHEGITVKDFQSSPAAGERTDLGQLTWTVDLEPAAQRGIEFGFRLEHARGLDLTGWTD
ncbi:DUF4139 domain-containing protein [Pseudofrankia asymbiotica]|uniref:Mucoidy inhibitor A n=1 Tax=Pseudofrankia asymbiotica TaxID=1834516 RepID=A0A1V2ID56_9ACTN|nr:DUF4139 domain-containing protein [Pseudofrankia asymbiotica]ONH30396.1 mucoidy inhibitor A [Pseudofrankia asymbiotica]